MRCESCSKFVSFDTDVEPEIEVEVSGDEVLGTARITNNCADCGDELQEAQFDVEAKILAAADHVAKCDGELSVEVANAGRTDRLESKTKDGKIIKHARYMKRLYGAEATFVVTCDKCDLREEIEWSDETYTSHMDALA